MLLRILLLILLSAISGALYRAGGKGKPFNTKFRDLGVPAVCIIALLTLWQPVNIVGWLILVVFFGLFFGSLTTYWDFLFKYDNFYMHGFMCGLATFPLCWVGLHLWSILIRALLCGIMVGLWSRWIGNDVLEEFGRGFILCATMSLLLI